MEENSNSVKQESFKNLHEISEIDNQSGTKATFVTVNNTLKSPVEGEILIK